MAHDVSAASWVAQSPERMMAIQDRRRTLMSVTVEDHFRRLVLEWAARDDGAFPCRAQAQSAAEHELEVICRWLGRFGALGPHEVFPRQTPDTTPRDDEGW